MANIKIAFQGEMGAYSHIACEQLFPGSSIKACPTFDETFRAANQDENCKIVIPIENSLAGRVADIHYLLPKYKLQIYAEHFQTVEHNLLVKEGVELKDIKYKRSHAQAIDQCQKIIQKHNFQTIISADTAGSAKELSKGSDKSIAAIASTLSAKIYKLKVLAKNIWLFFELRSGQIPPNNLRNFDKIWGISGTAYSVGGRTLSFSWKRSQSCSKIAGVALLAASTRPAMASFNAPVCAWARN